MHRQKSAFASSAKSSSSLEAAEDVSGSIINSRKPTCCTAGRLNPPRYTFMNAIKLVPHRMLCIRARLMRLTADKERPDGMAAAAYAGGLNRGIPGHRRLFLFVFRAGVLFFLVEISVASFLCFS